MSKKIYVKEEYLKNNDGERLVVINTYESKPKDFDYMVFVER